MVSVGELTGGERQMSFLDQDADRSLRSSRRTPTKSQRLGPPLKWHGGKHYLAQRIIGLFPRHLHYVEPYFGGGAVLLSRAPDRDWMKPNGGAPSYLRGSSEVANDINGNLMNFWSVLRDAAQFQRFVRTIQATPFSQPAWEAARESSAVDPVERAVQFFILARQSRQGLMKDFATLSRNRTRRGRNEQVSSWLTAVEGLADVHQRLHNVVILNDDATKVIRQQDGPNTLFYCDPPYLAETRVATDAYAHEMSRGDHQVLLATLAGIQGKFVLSGYPSRLYAEFEERNEWHCTRIAIDNKASAKKVKDKKLECLWTNYDPAVESLGGVRSPNA